MAKIHYVAPYFWPESIGSAPYCTDLARHLSDQGHDVRVISMRPFYPNPAEFADWLDGKRDDDKLDAIDILRAPFNPASSAGFKSRLLNDLRFGLHVIWQSIRLKHRSPDHVIVYVPSIIGACAAWISAVLNRSAYSIIVHDIESGLAKALGLMRNPIAQKILQRVERFVFNRAVNIIVLTTGMKHELQQIGCVRPISVLPIWSKPFPAKPADPSRPLTIGYSGNFGRKQNLDQLLPILQRVDQSDVPIRMILRGDGSEKARIEDAVRKLFLRDVRFEPLAPEEQLQHALQDIDLHLVPQAFGVANYALPSKLVTLMAAGRAFVSIAEPGSALDHIARESGAGLCLRPGQDDAVVKAVLDFADNRPELTAMGEKGRHYVMNKMSSAVLLPAYAQALGLAEDGQKPIGAVI